MNGLGTSLPDVIDLSPTDVHVVDLALDGAAPADPWDLLDDAERERAARFVFARDRRRFVVAHAQTRIVLGRCLRRPPESLRFSVGAHGKPRLREESLDLRFNLSHAAGRALLAFALGREIGVDLEHVRPLEVADLARRFFAAGERDALRALAPDEQVRAFFRCWTRKEAFIKARGDGLTFPLDGFEVSLGEETSPQLLRTCSAAPDALHRWRIASLPVHPGYAAAVAAEAGDWRVVRWMQLERVPGAER